MNPPARAPRSSIASTRGGAPRTTCPSGQIYLLDNPLLREPLRAEHVKPRLLGHWGTTPGLNFVYAHLNRVIRGARPRRDLRHGPRPRRPGAASPTPTSRAPTARSTRTIGRDEDGHAPAVPAVLLPRRHPEPRRAGDARARSTRAASSATRSSHAYGAAFDNPDLLVVLRRRRRRGRDRPAGRELALQQVPRPGPRRRGAARSCTSTATRSPTRPCWPASRERRAARAAAGLRPRAATSSRATSPADGASGAGRRRWTRRSTQIREIQARARAERRRDERPRWPMIVLRTPKGWTGPARGRRQAGRGHLALAPGAARRRCATTRSTCAQLEAWMRRYRPEELFDADGALAARARRARAARATGG